MKIVSFIRDVIIFDSGTILKYEHEQDCCEQVFADFEVLKDYNALGKNADKTIFDVDFDETATRMFANIDLVDGEGFKIRYTDGDFEGSVFVPCYNQQNGYYASDLVLVYIDGNEKSIINISDCVKDDIF